jgi:hypothetical protein
MRAYFVLRQGGCTLHATRNTQQFSVERAFHDLIEGRMARYNILYAFDLTCCVAHA